MEGFFAGMAEAGSRDLEKRRDSALEIKMRSALLEQQANIDKASNIQKSALARSNESAKYKEENNLGGGVLSAAESKLGMKSGALAGAGVKDSPIIQQLLKSADDRKMLTSKTGFGFKLDPDGIPQSQHATNLVGNQIGPETAMPGYAADRQKLDGIKSYTSMATESKMLFDDLNLHGFMGGLAHKVLPKDFQEKRDRLQNLVTQMGPIEARIFEGVPGGRYSAMLGQAMVRSTPSGNFPVGEFNDTWDSNLLKAYSIGKTIAPESVKLPTIMTERYGGLMHDINGAPVAAVDLSVKDGNVYFAGHGTPVAKLGSGQPSIDPIYTKGIAAAGASDALRAPGVITPTGMAEARKRLDARKAQGKGGK